MRLLVIRHAIAENREQFHERTGQDDSERPLTAKGEARMKRAAVGLRRYGPEVTVLATSPYLRARQTAQILVKRGGFPEALEVEWLAPDRRPEEFVDWLQRQAAESASELPGKPAAERPPTPDAGLVVAIVGHEPDLSKLIGWCVTGRRKSLGPLKKGAVCSIRFPDAVGAGMAQIEWLIEPGQLRRLRKR